MENQERKEAGKAGLAQGFEEFAVGGLEVAGVNSGGTGGGHEIGVVGPAGNNVDMKMPGHAGSGSAS